MLDRVREVDLRTVNARVFQSPVEKPPRRANERSARKVLFIAGLQRIPLHLYEAASIDGAKPGWQTLRYITLPQLRTTSAAVLLLLLIAAYQAFDEFYNLLSTARGYPPYARPPLVYLYYVALGQGQDLGVGSAGAVVLAAAIAVVTVVQARWFGLGRREA